jgi:hypothetical protein
MADELQLEGFGSDIKNTCSLVLCENASDLWIPYEFIGCEPLTRILLVGEHSSGTRGLIASESWTMILSMLGPTGSRNWSFIASLRKHMLEPVLIVVAPDVVVPASIVPILDMTLIVFRWLSEATSISLNAKSIFFPLNIQSSQIVAAQRAVWRGMALRTSDTNVSLITQETRPQGLCLVASVLEGGVVSLFWYRMKDSDNIMVKERQNSITMWLGAVSDRVISILRG